MANNNAPVRSRVPDLPNAERGGFCGALQRIQPSMPAVLARRLANKENYGLGKVSFVLCNSFEAAAFRVLYSAFMKMFFCNHYAFIRCSNIAIHTPLIFINVHFICVHIVKN